MSWSILTDPTGFYSWDVEDDTFYIFHGVPTGTEKWTDQFYEEPAEDWSVNAEPLDGAFYGWRAWLNPNAQSAQTFLGVAEAPEDFDVNPLEVTLEPEFVQQDDTIDARFYADDSGWVNITGFGVDD